MMISDSDEYVIDDEFEKEEEILEPGLEQSPSLDKCGICPFKCYNADPDEPTIRLKRKRALENCNVGGFLYNKRGFYTI